MLFMQCEGRERKEGRPKKIHLKTFFQDGVDCWVPVKSLIVKSIL